MSHRCRFIIGGHGEQRIVDSVKVGVSHYDFCDAPASIKRDGVWLCAEHYDFIEGNAVNYVAQDPNWLPIKMPDSAWED
jgi:hypothetical protein